MFYVKAEIADGVTIQAEVTHENVFNRCPRCGAEVAVDLAEIVTDDGLDLYGTALYCDECARAVRDDRAEEERRSMAMATPHNLPSFEWEPDERDRAAILLEIADYALSTADGCGPDSEEAAEAREVYFSVRGRPLADAKDEIQAFFYDLYTAVAGRIDRCYDKRPQLQRIIRLTLGIRGED